MPSKPKKPKARKLRVPVPAKPPKVIRPKKGKGSPPPRQKDWETD